MPTLILTLACGLLLPVALRADVTKAPKEVVKTINVKGLKQPLSRGRFGKPIEITSAEELAKVFPNKETQEQIKKKVDFSTQKLVYFAWAGSGQDKVIPKVVEEGGKKSVIINLQPGRTKDLRPHAVLLAIAKDVPYRVGRGGRVRPGGR
jgi:hypothetical protein